MHAKTAIKWGGPVALILLAVGQPPARSLAATIVLANRTAKPVEVDLLNPPAPPQHILLPAAEVAAARVEGGSTLQVSDKGQQRTYQLEPNSAHFFHRGNGALELEGIGLGVADDSADLKRGSAAGPAAGEAAPRPQPIKIPVRILVDDEELAVKARWEQRLRKRLADASEVFRRHCGVVFQVTDVATWDSDDATDDFELSLREFEKEVRPEPARLAIGFTSQYQLPQERVHLGGTHGPLSSHILLREWSQHVSEPERLELLIHELGHFLGAAHSPESDSVMRPILADRQAIRRSFRIGFDPINTLAMNLVAEGLHEPRLRGISGLSPENRHVLRQIYVTLAAAQPDDPAAAHMLALLGRPATVAAAPSIESPIISPKPAAAVTPLAPAPVASNPPAVSAPLEAMLPVIEASRSVIAALVAAASENADRPIGRVAGGEDLYRWTGDQLTQLYIRTAAAAAGRQSEAVRQQAFFMALAVALDTSDMLREHPLTGALMVRLETNSERLSRLAVIGTPTLRGRHDLLQHCVVSAAICSLGGAPLAESVGLAKELKDSESGSGFSFTDLAADLAGIAWVGRVQSGKLTLANMARDFDAANILPPLEGLVDGLSKAAFLESYGSVSDPRFLETLRMIRDRITALSP